MRLFHLAILLACAGSVLLLSACQPDYVRDSSQQLLRSTGVNHNYQISRTSTLTLSPQSFICLASASEGEFHRPLLDALYKAFDRRFAHVSMVEAVSADFGSKAHLACRGANFLVQAELVDTGCATNQPEDSADEDPLSVLEPREAAAGEVQNGATSAPESVDEGSSGSSAEQATPAQQACDAIHLRLRVHPMVGQSVVNIVDIQYRAGWARRQERDFVSIILPGLEEVAQRLSGGRVIES